MNKITASMSKISEDAFAQSEMNFKKSIDVIDSVFGEGYAKKNPSLIVAFLQASSTETAGSFIAAAIQDLSAKVEGIDNAISNPLSSQLENIAQNI